MDPMRTRDHGERPSWVDEALLACRDEAERIARRIARGTFGNIDADDLVQYAYLRALEYWPKFERGRDMLPWLTLIMSRRRFDLFKRGKRELVDAVDEWLSLLPEAPRQERLMLAGEAMAAVSRHPLGEALRRFVDGEECSEIAAALDLPMGTVRTRIFRVRAALAEAGYA